MNRRQGIGQAGVLGAFLVSAGLLVAAVHPGSALAAPTWLLPAKLSTPGQSAESPQLAVDPGGDAVAVWDRSDGTNTIVEAAARPAGGGWGTPVPLSTAGQNGHDPEVAIDSTGEALAVWDRYDGSDTIVESSAAPPGGAWSSSLPLSTPGQSAESPQLAVDPGGDAVAVWDRSDGTNTIVEAAARPAGGGWGTPVPLSTAGQNGHDPEVAIDSTGEALAVWDRYDGSDTIVESSAAPPGGAWSSSLPLSTPGQSAESPQLAVDPGGDAVAVWDRSDGTNTIVEAAARPAGGGWGTPVPLSTAGQNGHDPEVAIDSTGEALAVWDRYDGSDTIVESSAAPPGGAWSSSLPLSTPGQSAESPQLAVDPGGDAVAVWDRSDGTNTIVEAAARPAGGGWGTPVPLSTLGRSASSPEVDLDLGADALVVWQRNEGGHTQIEAAARDVAGPQLRSLDIPTAATVRRPLTFSVAPFDVFSAVPAIAWSFGDGGSAAGTAVTHTYSSPGTYEVSVTAEDAVGNATTTDALVSIFAKAGAQRIVRFKSRRAFLKLHCPSTARCQGEVSLIARVSTRHDRGGGHHRRPIALGAFEIPPQAVSTVRLRLTRAGLAAARAGRRGLKAQLTGEGVKHRLVLLLPLRR